uniref:Uncharacterized protein n=1 Tax=Romanomermis culicivorax TaxID=13658 RepID=A0A915L0M4_ROMCU
MEQNFHEADKRGFIADSVLTDERSETQTSRFNLIRYFYLVENLILYENAELLHSSGKGQDHWNSAMFIYCQYEQNMRQYH